jgi:Ca2+:H+ antiporter
MVRTPIATIVFPILALCFVGLTHVFHVEPARLEPLSLSVAASAVMIAVMLGAIFAAVHHADVIACRMGEPAGTLMLTLAVTIIEVSLIESIVLKQGSPPTLARDTVFSVIMIVCNGLVGLCVLLGALRYREQEFEVSGAGVYFNVLGALSILTLVLPNYTLTTPGPYFSTGQLIFVSVITIVLYGTFLFIQTLRHADYFRAQKALEPGGEIAYPSNRTVAVSAILLLLALGGVILIAEEFAVVVEDGLDYAGAPPAVAGIVIAMIVLAPESIAAVRAALGDVLQKSLNIALGSSLATIGLTVPAVAITNVVLGRQLALGLSPRDTLLLALTFFLSLLTFGSGRTNMLAGLVHLVVFATFVFLVFVP